MQGDSAERVDKLRRRSKGTYTRASSAFLASSATRVRSSSAFAAVSWCLHTPLSHKKEGEEAMQARAMILERPHTIKVHQPSPAQARTFLLSLPATSASSGCASAPSLPPSAPAAHVLPLTPPSPALRHQLSSLQDAPHRTRDTHTYASLAKVPSWQVQGSEWAAATYE